MLSPIQLIDSRYPCIEVKLNEHHDKDKEHPLNLLVETSISLDTEKNKQPNQSDQPIFANVLVCISNIEKVENYPLTFKISAEGQFNFYPDPNGMEHDEITKIIKINGSSILFGQIREMFYILTSRALGYQLQLPTLVPAKAFHTDLQETKELPIKD